MYEWVCFSGPCCCVHISISWMSCTSRCLCTAVVIIAVSMGVCLCMLLGLLCWCCQALQVRQLMCVSNIMHDQRCLPVHSRLCAHPGCWLGAVGISWRHACLPTCVLAARMHDMAVVNHCLPPASATSGCVFVTQIFCQEKGSVITGLHSPLQ